MTSAGGRATAAGDGAEVDGLNVVRGQVVHLEKLVLEVRGQMIFFLFMQEGIANAVWVGIRGCIFGDFSMTFAWFSYGVVEDEGRTFVASHILIIYRITKKVRMYTQNKQQDEVEIM